MLSAVGGGLAVALLFQLGRELGGVRLGVTAAALLTTSPLAWYYGAVGLTYGVELPLATLLALLVWRSVVRQDRPAALWSGIALALVGGFRPTSLVLLLPLWAFGVRRHPRHTIAASSSLLACGVLVWLVPLLSASSGPADFVAATTRLARRALGPTLAPVGDDDIPLSNLAFVSVAGLLGAGVAAAALPARMPGWFSRVRHDWRLAAFLLLWVVPALAVFLTLHVGQPGYLLLIWPAISLLLADALLGFASAIAALLARPRGSAHAVITTLAVLTNAAVFATTPNATSLDALGGERRFWRAVEELGRASPPDRVAVITGGRASESFRQAMVVLPEHTIYAIGPDSSRRTGILVTGRGDTSDYRAFLDGRPAEPWLPVSPGTQGLLVLDASTARLLGASLPLTAFQIAGRGLFWADLPPGCERIALATPGETDPCDMISTSQAASCVGPSDGQFDGGDHAAWPAGASSSSRSADTASSSALPELVNEHHRDDQASPRS